MFNGIKSTLKLLLKVGIKDTLIMALLKENKKLKLQLKYQTKDYSSEILRLRSELYDEKQYSRFKEKEFNKKLRELREERICEKSEKTQESVQLWV